MELNSKIFVAGHRGLVGSALLRQLELQGFDNLLADWKRETDLRNPDATRWFFSVHRPKYVFMAAAKVGGIMANTNGNASFMLDNLKIQNNIIEMSLEYGVEKLLFLGSACAYPKYAENPIKESSLLTGALEPSNEGYALAKIAGIKLCQYLHGCGKRFISCMPTNLYGIGDHYDLENSHVLPGMMRRIHEAKDKVVLWGTGRPTREFLFADDLAHACIFLMQKYEDKIPINIGSPDYMPLWVLADEIARVQGFKGKIEWDHTKPDGTPRRQLDSSRIRELGWSPRTKFLDGLKQTYQDFLCRKH